MRTRWILAIGLAAVGLVWIGQGLGLLRGSGFMVDDLRWAVVGAVLLLAGAVVGWGALRNRSRV
jgi:hypothetical protein